MATPTNVYWIALVGLLAAGVVVTLWRDRKLAKMVAGTVGVKVISVAPHGKDIMAEASYLESLLKIVEAEVEKIDPNVIPQIDGFAERLKGIVGRLTGASSKLAAKIEASPLTPIVEDVAKSTPAAPIVDGVEKAVADVAALDSQASTTDTQAG